jgi:PAS domain S-box-containing protein
MSTSKNERLYKKNLFLQSVINGVPECVLVIGPGYEVKLMNRAAGDFFFKCSEASEFQQCYKIFHGREKPCTIHNCPLEEVRKTGQPTRVVREHYNSNGEKRSLEILSSPLYGEDGTFQGIIQCSHDITMSAQAEKNLMATIAAVEDEKNKSEAIIAALGDGLIIQDTDYKIIYQNQVQNDLYGDMIGELCYKAYEGSDKICEDCPVEKTFRDGKIHMSERRVATDKGVLYFELTSSPLKDSTGKIIAGIKVVREITGRKHVEEELHQSHNLLEAIRNAQSSFIEDSDKQILFDNILQELISLTQSEYGLIGEVFYNTEGNPYLKEFANLKTLFGQVIISGKPLISNNLSADEWNGKIPEDHPPLNSFMIIPFFQANKFVGIAGIANRPGGYDEELVHYLQPLLNTCANIIEAYKNSQKRKQAEEELRESERFMDSIFASIQDGIGIIDKEMNIIRVNKTAESWYWHAMPLVGKKCYEAYHNRKEQCEFCPAQETFVTGNSAYRTVPKHGPGGKEVGWHEIYSYPLKDTTTGQMKGVIEYVRNITERKLVEEELKQSEEKYRLLIENIQEGVFVIQDAKMQFVNKAFRNITGYGNEEIIGIDFRHFVAPEDLEMVQDRYSRRQKGENVPDEYEFHALRRDGEKIVINMSVGLVTYRGRIASMGVINDITERKKREEAILRYNLEIKESNRMKELFADIMHHDLLNPLNVANGYVEFFMEVEKDPDKKSYLETIKRNLVKGMELIENATKFSKLESMKKIEFDDLDLKMVVLEVIENLTPLAVRAGISIEDHLESSMPARGNKIIEDIFINIISNAIKYASTGKRIVVDGKDGINSWIIGVVDFGPGIKDVDKKLIFERFHREEKKGVKGSGLGLAIAGKIAELHKGRIWVEDNPEGGAIFKVEIPKS